MKLRKPARGRNSVRQKFYFSEGFKIFSVIMNLDSSVQPTYTGTFVWPNVISLLQKEMKIV